VKVMYSPVKNLKMRISLFAIVSFLFTFSITLYCRTLADLTFMCFLWKVLLLLQGLFSIFEWGFRSEIQLCQSKQQPYFKLKRSCTSVILLWCKVIFCEDYLGFFIQHCCGHQSTLGSRYRARANNETPLRDSL